MMQLKLPFFAIYNKNDESVAAECLPLEYVPWIELFLYKSSKISVSYKSFEP